MPKKSKPNKPAQPRGVMPKLIATLKIPAAEQALVTQCFEQGTDDFYIYERREHWWTNNELLKRPYVLGFGAVRAVRSPGLSPSTRVKIALYTIAQAQVMADWGLPFGIPILLSFLAEADSLKASLLTESIRIAEINRDFMDGWLLEEMCGLLNWIITKSDISENDQLWWLYYFLAHTQKPDIGKKLFSFCLGHPTLARGTMKALCYSILAEDKDAGPKPPALWRVNQALITGNEQQFNEAKAELDPELAQIYAIPSEAFEQDAEAADNQQDFSMAFMLSLFRGGMLWLRDSLKRQAILALSDLGEDPLAVCDQYLHRRRMDTATAAIGEGVVDIIRAHHTTMSPQSIRDLIERGLNLGSVPARKSFYRLGMELFGAEYLERARKDNAASVRKWIAETGGQPQKKGRKRGDSEPGE